jgi:subtilisin family serine protease
MTSAGNGRATPARYLHRMFATCRPARISLLRLTRLAAAGLALLPLMAGAVPLPIGVADALARGEPQDLIVDFDASSVDRESMALRKRLDIRHDNKDVLKLREARYREIKAGVRASLPPGEHEAVADFHLLPLAMVRIRSSRALAALANRREVVGIYRNELKFPVPDKVPQLDSQSQTLIGQPVAAAAGLTGVGTTVLVIDSGANYTVSDLGSCSAPATPATCRISHALYVNNFNTVVSDPTPVASASNDHGTNVAAIVAGVATKTRVAVVNIFGTNTTTTDAKILAAINWGIANQSTYNIRSLNLSLGDNVLHTSPCTSSNPYVSAFASALSAGIIPVAASGNNAFLNGVAGPACTPGALSVGAVYAANFGPVGWSNCSDSATAADKVVCFSNSASFLGMLAPGAIITAGGQTMGGTSQASPFVAATVGLLYAAYPASTTAEQISRLKTGGVSVTDTRNSLVAKRLDLNALASAVVTATSAADVPTLPEWGLLLLGGLLLAQSVARPSRALSLRPPA